MRVRFVFESLVGLIGMVAVLLLGSVGGLFMMLFVFFPAIVRLNKAHKPDERELQLFYQASNFTLILIFIALVLIYVASGVTLNGHQIGDNWYLLSISSILFIHGLIGLVVFRRVS